MFLSFDPTEIKATPNNVNEPPIISIHVRESSLNNIPKQDANTGANNNIGFTLLT